MNKLSVEEFKEQGYLQELNRRFLHPLGLALEVLIDKSGELQLNKIWDCREHPEGIYFDIANSDSERQLRFKKNKFNFKSVFVFIFIKSIN